MSKIDFVVLFGMIGLKNGIHAVRTLEYYTLKEYTDLDVTGEEKHDICRILVDITRSMTYYNRDTSS